MKKTIITMAVIFGAMVLCLFGCAVKSEPFDITQITSYKEIPGITQEEIAAIEALRESREFFVYGMVLNTESFYDIYGKINGYSALVSDWLTKLFGIPFILKIFTLEDLTAGLASHEIDFCGYFMNTEWRREIFHMTGPISPRQIKYFRLADSKPFSEISETRLPRYMLVANSAVSHLVHSHAQHEFEPFFVNNHRGAYNLLKKGEADAFISIANLETIFEAYDDVVTSDFYPLLFSSGSISTQNPELSPFISVLQKALDNGAIRYLNELYKQGEQQYRQHKFLLQLTEEERAYIRDNPYVMFGADYSHYPVSFFNQRDNEWQGISIDVLREIEILTGLKFIIANDNKTEWHELLKMLENNETYMLVDLLRTPQREGRFLWANNTYITDFPVLISKMNHPNIRPVDVYSVRVGLSKGTAYTELFNRWFPNHKNTFMYDGQRESFNALLSGEVDMVMNSYNGILFITHFQELSGYKVNVVFDHTFESTFGFHKDRYVLCSILDKALPFVDTETISNQWLLRTFDYRAKMMEAQMPWIIGIAVTSLLAFILLTILHIVNGRKNETISKQATILSAIYDSTPVMVFTKDLNDRYTSCNRKFEEEFHVIKENIIGKSFTDIVPIINKDVVPEFSRATKNVLINGKTLLTENWYNYFDGSRRAIEIIRTPLVQNNKVVGLLGIATDITERKTAEKMLLHKQKMLCLVNNAAKMLLTAQNSDELKDAILTSMESIGGCINTDFVELWQNEMRDGELCAVLKYFWHSEDGKKNKLITTDYFPYSTSPNWDKRLTYGEIINGPVSTLSQEDQDFLNSYGIISALVMPIFINNKFWGFCCIDDYTKSRSFTEDEMDIFKSMNLMTASTINRHSLSREIDKAHKYAKIMMDSIPICCALMRKDLTCIDCNNAAVEIAEVKDKQEFMDRYHNFDFMPKFQPNGQDTIEMVRNYAQIAEEEGKHSFEVLYQTVNGSPRPVLVTFVRIDYENEDGFIILSAVQDLREHKRMTARIEAIINNLPGMVYQQIYNPPNYTCTFVSRGCKELTGYTADELTGENAVSLFDLIHHEDAPSVEKVSAETLANGLPYECIYRIRTKDGKEKWLWEHSRVIEKNLDGTPKLIENYATDITEKYSLEAAEKARTLAEAASRAKSEFVAVMSHEIRTPMNSVMGFAELALDSTSTSQTKDYLAKILDSTKWLLRIINDILDISKIESGKMELDKTPFDLRSIVSRCQSVVLPVTKEKGIDLRIYAEAPQGKKLIGDSVRLYQVLMNLLSNSVKFTNSGVVKLTSSIKSCENGKAKLYFEVKDEGIGMSSEQIEKIFEPFIQADSSTTRKYGGTGLGLTIAKNIIEMMGGKLSVESALGVGTTFHFEIEFETINSDDDTDDSNEKPCVIDKPHFEGLVLVCDDNIMNQEVICEHISRVGLKAMVAENGKVGVEKVLERKKKGEKPFDLILMDIFMPVMDGTEAAAKIIEAGITTPIIAITANIMPSELINYKNSGMSDCLGKPFSSQELWRLLLKYLSPISSCSVNESEQEDENSDLQRKLRVNFVKNNQNIYAQIKGAIAQKDMVLAHRLAHTLKGNAGMIGKTELQKAAAQLDGLLKEGIVPLPHIMKILETKITSTLDELSGLLEEAPRRKAELSAEQTKELFEVLEEMLENINPESVNLIDDIRAVAGADELARQIENYDFETAKRTLAELKKKWS